MSKHAIIKHPLPPQVLCIFCSHRLAIKSGAQFSSNALSSLSKRQTSSLTARQFSAFVSKEQDSRLTASRAAKDQPSEQERKAPLAKAQVQHGRAVRITRVEYKSQDNTDQHRHPKTSSNRPSPRRESDQSNARKYDPVISALKRRGRFPTRTSTAVYKPKVATKLSQTRLPGTPTGEQTTSQETYTNVDAGDGTRSTFRSLVQLAEQTLSSRRFSGGTERKEHGQIGRRRKGDDVGRHDTSRRTRRVGGQEDDYRSARHDRFDEEDDDDDVYGYRREAAERRAQRQAEQARQRRERLEISAAKRKADGKPIVLPAFISLSNLAQLLGVHFDRFERRLAHLGFDDLFTGKVLDAETASLIAMEYGFNPFADDGSEQSKDRDLVPEPETEPGDKELLPIRPPVVTIMGHVDHGKTTILDYLRKANVVASEAGGITQHIGAFSVVLPTTGRTITFLDTPGHAAFLAMRQRGANVTDIVILVVAADDSIMPQTLEALKHARAARVPIIVAINKVDKPEADINRVKQDLSRHGVEIEDYGGDVQVVPVSGKTGLGMDALEEAIVSQAELLDYRSETDCKIDGWVLEASVKKAGRMATVLVRRGVLRPGSVIVSGTTWARIRVLSDHTGAKLDEVLPGTSAEVDGWREQPNAGDRVLQADDEQHAGSVVEYRIDVQERKQALEDTQTINKQRLEAQLARERERTVSTESKQHNTAVDPSRSDESGQLSVPFIIRADVSGSAEALSAYVEGAGSPMITPRILQALVGSVHESDVELASVAKGIIIAFNVDIDERIRSLAAFHNVRILEHNIIYRVVDEVREILVDKLPAVINHKVSGEAEISQSFSIGVGGRRTKTIAGCKVRNGVIEMGSRARVMRGTAKIYDGSISSLKNVKKDVNEMRKGSECGIGLQDWDSFEPGDIIQTYIEVSERRTL